MSASSQPDIQRVREDLAAMQQAAGIGSPFGREVLVFWVLVAAICLDAVGTFLFVPPRFQWIPLVILGGLGAGLMVRVFFHVVQLGASRAEKPAPWREMRSILMAKAVLLPFVIGFFLWQHSIGAPLVYIASTFVFFTGVVSLLYGLSSWSRRFGIGIAIPSMAFGALLPVLGAAQIPVFFALWGALGGVLSALILAWQLKRTPTLES